MAPRIALLRPSNPSGSGYLTKWGFLPTPLGLLALAGSLRAHGFNDIMILDMEADSLSVDQAVSRILDFDADVVGITLHATAAHGTSIEIVRKLRERKGSIVTVAGGHHATFLPEEMVKAGFHVSVLGEGDDAISEIVHCVANGRGFGEVRGIVFSDSGKIVRTKPRPLMRSLDDLAMPAFDLVNPESYRFDVFGKDNRVACVETSRGCPYACDFCSVTPTWGNKWRNKSNQRIMEELRFIKSLGFNWVFFTDDIFVVGTNTDQRRELFRMMIAENLGLKYIVQMRADVTARNPDLIRMAAESGMTIAFLGIESGSQEVLKKMHKGIFTPQSVQAVKTLNSNGIITLIGMMVGAPYERVSDMISTIRFSRKLADAGADAVQFSCYTPLPGTRVFYDSLKNDRLFTLDWDRYDVLTPVMYTRVNPILTQIMQFYGVYSFYVIKYFKGKMKGIVAKGAKRDLLFNAQKYIFAMMPKYIREFLRFPKLLLETYDHLAEFRQRRRTGITQVALDKESLLLQSSRIVYDQGDGLNPYFMISQQH